MTNLIIICQLQYKSHLHIRKGNVPHTRQQSDFCVSRGGEDGGRRHADEAGSRGEAEVRGTGHVVLHTHTLCGERGQIVLAKFMTIFFCCFYVFL